MQYQVNQEMPVVLSVHPKIPLQTQRIISNQISNVLESRDKQSGTRFSSSLMSSRNHRIFESSQLKKNFLFSTSEEYERFYRKLIENQTKDEPENQTDNYNISNKGCQSYLHPDSQYNEGFIPEDLWQKQLLNTRYKRLSSQSVNEENNQKTIKPLMKTKHKPHHYHFEWQSVPEVIEDLKSELEQENFPGFLLDDTRYLIAQPGITIYFQNMVNIYKERIKYEDDGEEDNSEASEISHHHAFVHEQNGGQNANNVHFNQIFIDVKKLHKEITQNSSKKNDATSNKNLKHSTKMSRAKSILRWGLNKNNKSREPWANKILTRKSRKSCAKNSENLKIAKTGRFPSNDLSTRKINLNVSNNPLKFPSYIRPTRRSTANQRDTGKQDLISPSSSEDIKSHSIKYWRNQKHTSEDFLTDNQIDSASEDEMSMKCAENDDSFLKPNCDCSRAKCGANSGLGDRIPESIDLSALSYLKDKIDTDLKNEMSVKEVSDYYVNLSDLAKNCDLSSDISFCHSSNHEESRDFNRFGANLHPIKMMKSQGLITKSKAGRYNPCILPTPHPLEELKMKWLQESGTMYNKQNAIPMAHPIDELKSQLF